MTLLFLRNIHKDLSIRTPHHARLLWLICMAISFTGLIGCTSGNLSTPSLPSTDFLASSLPTQESSLSMPTAILTIASSDTPTPITMSMTNTPISATSTPTPTPSEVVWTTNVQVKTRFVSSFQRDRRHVQWSPTVNEFLLSDCDDVDDNKNTGIFKVSAPLFRIEDITPRSFFCVYTFDMVWSPTGEYIVTVVPDENNPQPSNSALIAILSQDGSIINSGINFIGGAFDAYFQTWINNETLLFSSYVGGSENEYLVMDIISGEILGRWYSPGLMLKPGYLEDISQADYVNESGYIRAYRCRGYLECSAMTALINDKNGHVAVEGKQGLSITFPDQGVFDLEKPMSLPLDWMPNSNLMLVETWRLTDEVSDDAYTSEQLQLWNIESNELIPVVTGGVNGLYTPDGSALGVWSEAPIQYDETGIPIKVNVSTILPDSIYYLSLVDAYTYETIFSIPVVCGMIDCKSPVLRYEYEFSDIAQYSPDGKVTTIWTVGALDTDADGKVIDTDITNWGKSEDEIYTYLLETQTGKVIHSIRGYHTEPAWSHASDKAIFQDEQGNWVIYTLVDGTVVPLTEAGGMYLQSPQWSFDDTYISFEIKKSFDDLQTVVLTVP